MSRSYQFYSHWEQFNGKEIWIDNLKYKLKVTVYDGIYPIKQRMINVEARPVSKESKHYKETKRILKDDWSTDVLASGDELQCDILNQLGYKP